MKKRKEGLQISYKNAEGDWVNEQYIGTTFIDTEWVKDSNWEKIPNNSDVENNIVYHLGHINFVQGESIDHDGTKRTGVYYCNSGKIRIEDNIIGFYVKKLQNGLKNVENFIFYNEDEVVLYDTKKAEIVDYYIEKPNNANYVLFNGGTNGGIDINLQVVGIVYKGNEVYSDYEKATNESLLNKQALLPIKNKSDNAYNLSPKYDYPTKMITASNGGIVIKTDGSQIETSTLDASTGYSEIKQGYRYNVTQTRAATGCYPITFFKKEGEEYIMLGGLGTSQSSYTGEFIPNDIYPEATHIAFTLYLSAGNNLSIKLRPLEISITYNLEGGNYSLATSHETKTLLDYNAKMRLDRPGNALLETDNLLNPYECSFEGGWVYSPRIPAKEGEVIYCNGSIYRCYGANGNLLASSQQGTLTSGQALPTGTASVQGGWRPSGVEDATMDMFMAGNPHISYSKNPKRYAVEFNPYLFNIYDRLFRELYQPFAGRTMFNIGDSMTMQANAYWYGSYMGTISKYTGLVSVGNTDRWGNGKSLSNVAQELIDNTQGFREQIAKADIVTIYLGTNDYGHSDKEPGTVFDDYDSGTITIMSCVKSIIKSILECNPYAIPIFFSQPERQKYVDNIQPPALTAKGLNMYVIANAIQEACKFVGVPYCDTHSLCHITMQTTDQYTTDGLHIGVQTIGQYIGKIMAKFINSLDYTSVS